MKDETGSITNQEFVGLKPNMYSYLVNDNSEYRRAKGMNKNVVATISHNKSKDVLLNQKCLRRTTNRIQSKDLMKSTRFLCLALMIKYLSKTMDVMDY